MRSTKHRLEAIHGTFRGSTCSLPITSSNLSFREFLEKMNKMLQVHTTEQVKGHSIVSSRMKRKTFSKNHSEVEDDCSILSGSSSYQDFQSKLIEACVHGDKDSKDLIEKLAPKMAAFLKKNSKWDSKEIMHTNENVLLAKSKDDVTNLTTDNGIFQQLIQLKLGPVVHVHEAEGETVTNCEGPIDTQKHWLIILLDVSPTTEPTTTLTGRPQLVRALYNHKKRFQVRIEKKGLQLVLSKGMSVGLKNMIYMSFIFWLFCQPVPILGVESFLYLGRFFYY